MKWPRSKGDDAVTGRLELLAVGVTPAQQARLSTVVDVAFALTPVHDVHELREIGFQRDSIVIIGSDAVEEGLAWLEHANASGRPGAVVLYVDRTNASLLRRALRAGVLDVVRAAADGTDLRSALARAMNSVAARPLGDGDRGSAVVVFGPKGGVGATSIAINLAAACGARDARGAALIDFDLPFGDIAVQLGVEPTRNLADVGVGEPGRVLDAMTHCTRAPIHALLAPADPTRSERIEVDSPKMVINALRDAYPITFVDVRSSIDDLTLNVIEAVDRVVVVTAPEIGAIKNAKVAMHALELIEYPRDRVDVVVNRVGASKPLGTADVARTLGELAAVVPFDPELEAATFEGVPVVIAASRSKSARAIRAFADELFDHTRAEVVACR